MACLTRFVEDGHSRVTEMGEKVQGYNREARAGLRRSGAIGPSPHAFNETASTKICLNLPPCDINSLNILKSPTAFTMSTIILA